ncbi:winged helix-turn-helix transcriptional regulator [Clostridiales bacterium BAD-6]|jgi:DNA-binding transcriptional ArsR family regulator|uniref:Winged helix-turn-helix transcriptional regulator n=2 Tax=Sinanaerobacter chloroacetimidivorans TaxID=2818044 RepID=A0A8J8B3W2_9FIRM|nr:winged helix-turn-helix transcriptional regulator [Sinanaerobacter chloroacetimidivorans]
MNNQKILYQMHADFCKFMSNALRIEILFLLGNKEMCVEDLASAMDAKLPNVSQHLAIMREKGIVKVRREGNRMYYSLSNPKTLKACNIMREAMIEEMKKNIGLVSEFTEEINEI